VASHRLKRTMRGALAATAVAVAVSLLPAPATAEPNTPANASDAQKQLAELGRQAEIITEKVHQAEDAVAAVQAGEAVLVDRVLPGEEFFDRQRIATAGLLEGKESAAHGSDNLGLAPDDPTLRTRCRQVGDR